MTVKIFQIMKLIETIQFYQNNQVANRGNVKRDFELQGITKGLEYPNYDSNERFCLDGGILKLENDELYFTKLGKILLENIDSTDRFNDVFIKNFILKNNFSEIIIPILSEFHESDDGKLWYEKKEIVNLFERKDILPILYELGLLIKNGNQIVVNSIYQKNEIIKEQQKKKRKISQIQLEKTLEIEKKVGQIAEKIVLDFEKNRLEKDGYLKKAQKVEQISEDWANKGYDIESFDGPGEEILPDRFIEVKGTTGKNFSIFWSENEIKKAKELREKYWIYFVSEIDIENETSPKNPERIQDPFIEIDPYNNNENNDFNKKFESIHVTKNNEN
tara:strand:- start:2190 stop:3185 length:996 start_codon:yes stop_codon:yes gene_type:complete